MKTRAHEDKLKELLECVDYMYHEYDIPITKIFELRQKITVVTFLAFSAGINETKQDTDNKVQLNS